MLRSDLLATPRGRKLAFFLLYVTEGIPLGFTATAVATQMRRQDVGPEAIGVFVASLYAPWGLKWIAGPFVDTLTVRRFGPRRFWILTTQILMIATILVAMQVDFASQIQLFTAVIFLHNVFGAVQDVAIDALAVNTLAEHERGAVNGFMFGGAYAGQAIGGSGVLFLTPVIGFPSTFVVVAACIALVTLFVVLPMREPVVPAAVVAAGSAMKRVASQLGRFVMDTVRAFLGTRAAFVGVLFALLPGGAYALGLALQSNVAVELGMNDTQVAQLTLASSIIAAVFCVVGGWMSDRYGRRGTLAWTMAATAIPTVMLGLSMREHGWIHAIPAGATDRPVPPTALIQMFWVTVLIYNVFQGLYYGIRSALFMDVTTPKVAATQFTAYMALMNVAISLSARWQGWAIERWGYPLTLMADAAIGMVCLLCLPAMRPAKGPRPAIPPGAAVPEAIEP